jgi:putative FmdB family regulatory protein
VPTYDYRCRDCGHTFEIVHSILEDGPTTCTQCGGKLDPVLHPAGVIFKGSGFYATDSRKAPPSEGAGSSSGDGAKESSPSKDGGSPKDGGTKGSTDSAAKPGSTGAD